MAQKLIKSLFARDIGRSIEEVIKVDQTDEEIIREEIEEYEVTKALCSRYTEILERYCETPNKPHEGIAVWISGFFGSGKSSFAKILGLALANRSIDKEPASRRFAARAGDKRIEVLLTAIAEKIPTHAVIFDVSTDRGIKSGNQTITEIMYRLFLLSLRYAGSIDLAELEIALEGDGRLDKFKAAYRRLLKKDWDGEKGKVAFALSEASQVMHELEPATYPMADSWVKAIQGRVDITAGKLADRCSELMKRRMPGKSLVFVIDEVGQFVARDIQKMLDLQAVVQSLGRVGRGRHWIVVTSQEKLGELVSGLDDKRVEIARLMDRFPLQVHLEPSDISEVTSRRVLSKNAAAQKTLRELFEAHRGRLAATTRLTADIRLPELSADSFVDLYLLLPYQIDLIIQVVSGLRTQGSGARHVGGANRTIIKLAQQVLINPAVNLAEQPIGALVRLDQVYDLVEGNIASEIRGKIAGIGKEISPFAQAVAKVVCLLQYVKSVHRSAENIAAALHPAVDADSQLPAVKEALDQLVKAQKVRAGEDGYRIPTPAEDDWERQRAGLSPKPGDSLRIQTETLLGFWQPQPSHELLGTKTFKAGLLLNGRPVLDGDMSVQMHLAEVGTQFTTLVEETRARSQQEPKSLFWAVPIDAAVDRETVEVYRSKEMLSRKEREAKTAEESNLITEERARLGGHQASLRRVLKQAALTGSVFFRGNDRSPGEDATEVGGSASALLGVVLPEVFDRFQEAAARVQKKDLDSLLLSENLAGMTAVFSDLKLLRYEKGNPVFNAEAGPLAQVLARIENRASYGEAATGRFLSDEFGKEPFGWDFEVVRLLTLCLLRAGKIEATSKGQTFDSAISVETRDTFSNNNLFRQATFRPKAAPPFELLLKASEAFKAVFGREVKELEQGKIAAVIREELAAREEPLRWAFNTLARHQLPGTDVFEAVQTSIQAIRGPNDANAIRDFTSEFGSIKEAIRRAAELERTLTEPALRDLGRAREALATQWPFLCDEPDLPDTVRAKALELEDCLQRESFFRDLPAIEQSTRVLDEEYERRYREASEERAQEYLQALAHLTATSEWKDVGDEQRQRLAAPLQTRATPASDRRTPIPQLRADTEACSARLLDAIESLMKVRDGDRVVTLAASDFFSGGIETVEQLEAALQALREECARLIAAGKKVLLQ